MDKKNIKISCLLIAFVFLFFIFYFLFSTVNVSAQTETTETNDNIDISCKTYSYPWCGTGTQNPGGLIARFYQIALGLAGAAALAVLIYGSILWTVSGAVTSKQDAIQWISAALWGFALLLAAYLILYTINPDLVNLKSGEALFQPVKTAVQATEKENNIPTITLLNCSTEVWTLSDGVICKPSNWTSLTNADKVKYIKQNEKKMVCPEGQIIIKKYDFTGQFFLPVLVGLYCEKR